MREIDTIKIDFIVLTETKKKRSGIKTTGESIHLIIFKSSKGRESKARSINFSEK